VPVEIDESSLKNTSKENEPTLVVRLLLDRTGNQGSGRSDFSPRDLIDTICEKETTIKDGNFSIFCRTVRSIEIDDAVAHCRDADLQF